MTHEGLYQSAVKFIAQRIDSPAHAWPRFGRDIALVEEDDLIRIDIPERILEIVGVKGQELPRQEVDRILAERKKAWKPKTPKYTKGVLKIYSEHAVSPMKGGYME